MGDVCHRDGQDEGADHDQRRGVPIDGIAGMALCSSGPHLMAAADTDPASADPHAAEPSTGQLITPSPWLCGRSGLSSDPPGQRPRRSWGLCSLRVGRERSNGYPPNGGCMRRAMCVRDQPSLGLSPIAMKDAMPVYQAPPGCAK